MKVLHVTSGNLYGGIETMLVALARHADAAGGMDTRFAVSFSGRCSEELQSAGAKVYELGPVRARNPVGVRRARAALRRIVRDDGIDIVVCHSSWPLAMFGRAARAEGCPLVLWQHGPLGGAFWLERWSRRVRPDLVICNSTHTAESVRGGYPGVRLSVLHYPVSMSSDADLMTRIEREAVRGEFGAGIDDVVIVQVSRMEEWKGHRLHLEALARIRDVDGWVCWMVGGAQRPAEERYLESLMQLAERLGLRERVRFVGQRSDVTRILGAADIHCQPNTGPEPFGITFIEAMTFGLPVVTTSMGGAKEIVDGTCGILVDEPGASQLAGALRALIADPDLRRRLGGSGPARARLLCDPVQQVRRLEELLLTLRPIERSAA